MRVPPVVTRRLDALTPRRALPWVALLALAAVTAQPVAAAPRVPVATAGGPAQQGLGGWQGVPVPEATCGRGAPYKYYLNPAPNPKAGLLFVLSGGGVCLKDGPAPAGASGPAQQLYCMNFSNFVDPFISDTTMLSGLGPAAVPYLRRDAGNPFQSYTFVVLPYCTGDIFTGRATEPYDYDPAPDRTFDVVHRGALNVLAVLNDVQRQYPDDVPVLLTGFSAGGFGAIFNFPEVIARWPRTTLLPDAGIGPPHVLSLMRRASQTVADRWGARASLPPYCQAPECLSDTLNLLAAHAAHYDGTHGPRRPFGYLQGQQDGTLKDFLEIPACGYELGLRQGYEAARHLTNLRAWLPATTDHVFSFRSGYVTPIGKVAMLPWFSAVGLATSDADLPPDAVDPWMACNPLSLPALWR
jgi:hypothetical protein